MEIHIHIHHHWDGSVLTILDTIRQEIAGNAKKLDQILEKEEELMTQSADLTAAVAALSTAATSSEAAIAAELATIAANSGDNPDVATAIDNIKTITAGLVQAAASVPPAAPAAPAS